MKFLEVCDDGNDIISHNVNILQRNWQQKNPNE